MLSRRRLKARRTLKEPSPLSAWTRFEFRFGRVKVSQLSTFLFLPSSCDGNLLSLGPHSTDWIPGQHVFLHCPNESLGGHPFTGSFHHFLLSSRRLSSRRQSSHIFSTSLAVSNISRSLEQGDNKRPFESQQELLIRVRGGLTKHLLQTAMSSQDDETAVDGKGFPREPVPIKAWTEGPCEPSLFLVLTLSSRRN